MTVNSFSPKDVGDRSKLTATFRDLDNAIFDPPVVIVKVKTPAGVESTYQYSLDAGVIRVSEGVYTFEQPWTTNGNWYVRFLAMADGDDIDSALVAYEFTARVVKSAFTTPIV